MTLPWLENWTGLSLGDPADDSPDWTHSGAGPFTIVETNAFSPGERSALHESTTVFGLVARNDVAAEVFRSFYWRHTIRSGTGNIVIGFIREGSGSGAAASAQLRISSGVFQIRNGNTAVASSSLTATQDQWYRVEWRVNALNNQTLRIFTGSNLHGTVPDEIIDGSATNILGAGGVAIGMVANVNLMEVDQQYSYLQAADTGYPDPWQDEDPPPVDAPTFAEWDGTSLVPLTVSEWDGTSLVPLTVSETP